jgi:hypothetical protein
MTESRLTTPQDFITGLRIISRHLRESCFAYPGNDDTPNKQVWARMKNTIIEDRAQFDCVPPTVIQRHFQTWIEEQGCHLLNDPSPDPSLKGSSSASYRFCIIIDAEALRNLLRFSPSADPQPSHRDRIGVKVLDVECHEDAEDYEPPFDQGWMWAGPNNLAEIWFDIIDYGIEEIYDTDELGRPVIMEY